MRRDRTYVSWQHMKQRCDNPNHHAADAYQGRGITYDPDWGCYDHFLRDMGYRPEGTSLERIDNDKGYCKSNCKWATREEQNNNRRSRRIMRTPRCDNTTGILGIHIDSREGRSIRYTAAVFPGGKRKTLYYGDDFFEACCARKSYEAQVLKDKNANYS